MRKEPGLSPDDVLTAVTTISFDIADLELYLPLLVGARIEMVDRETATDGELLKFFPKRSPSAPHCPAWRRPAAAACSRPPPSSAAWPETSSLPNLAFHL
jgi:non-ribosomal peptide synthetase component F